MDVEWLFYCFTKILGNSEEEFWRSTPRKIFKLIDVHCKFNSPNEDKNVKKSKNGSYVTDNKKVLRCLD